MHYTMYIRNIIRIKCHYYYQSFLRLVDCVLIQRKYYFHSKLFFVELHPESRPAGTDPLCFLLISLASSRLLHSSGTIPTVHTDFRIICSRWVARVKNEDKFNNYSIARYNFSTCSVFSHFHFSEWNLSRKFHHNTVSRNFRKFNYSLLRLYTIESRAFIVYLMDLEEIFILRHYYVITWRTTSFTLRVSMLFTRVFLT